VKGLLRVISLMPLAKCQTATSQLAAPGRASGQPASRVCRESVRQGCAGNKACLRKETVLVVHSDRVVRRRYSRTLGTMYTVHECDTATVALEALRNGQVDLICWTARCKIHPATPSARF